MCDDLDWVMLMFVSDNIKESIPFDLPQSNPLVRRVNIADIEITYVVLIFST